MEDYKQPGYREDIRTGRLTPKFIGDLKNSISKYISWHGYYYIGISNDPQRRNIEHSRHKSHSEMVVLFRTSSINVCKTLEFELVEYYRNSEKYCDLNYNSVAGGGGNYSEAGPYYLYLLLWE